MSIPPTYTIRKAVAKDVPAMMQLVKELAEFEKLPHEVQLTESQMLADGFGDRPAFEALVAEDNGKLVGLTVYYFSYSTWKGRCMYLDDIIVTESYRGKGLGTALMHQAIEVAKQEKVGKLHWQVLDWNTPAIRFYEKFTSRFDTGWNNVALPASQLQEISTVSRMV